MQQQGFAPWSGNNSHQAGPSQAPVRSRVIPGVMNQEKRDFRPGPWQGSPYEALLETTVLPKKRTRRSKNNALTTNIRPFHLGKEVDDADYDGVMITCATYAGEYISFYNVNHNKVTQWPHNYVELETFLRNPEPIHLDFHVKGYVVDPHFWKELVPFACMGKSDGWLSDDHINAWMELLIRQRREGHCWTLAKSTLASYSLGTTVFLLVTYSELQGTLSGRTLPYPSWDQVFMPIHAEGNHWVTGVVNIVYSTIAVFDSMESYTRKENLWKHINAWTKVLNESLHMQGLIEVTGR